MISGRTLSHTTAVHLSTVLVALSIPTPAWAGERQRGMKTQQATGFQPTCRRPLVAVLGALAAPQL